MRFTFLWLLILITFSLTGQGTMDKVGEFSPDPLMIFDQAEFNGRFAVVAQSYENYDYYVTDLTRLENRFERIYFLNLSYGDSRIVNIDPDISKSQLWFKAYYQHPQNEMICLLEEFLREAVKASQEWTASEKKSWMQKHDKFNTLKHYEE